MKNKKLTYILLPLVIILWGMIFYKFFDVVSGDGNAITGDKYIPPAKISSSVALDTFSIVASYRDPFLGTIPLYKPDVTKKVKPVKPSPTQSVDWSAISYKGNIQNQGNGKQLAIITIRGKTNMLSTGDTLQGFKIGKIFRDSVEVFYGREKIICTKM